jgi:hypothetical protein
VLLISRTKTRTFYQTVAVESTKTLLSTNFPSLTCFSTNGTNQNPTAFAVGTSWKSPENGFANSINLPAT